MSLDSMKEIFDRMEAEHKPFWEIVLETDMDERQVTRQQSMAKMLTTWQYMVDAADTYTGRRRSVSGLVGGDGLKMRQYSIRGRAMSGGYVSEVIAEALSMAESNACMRRIVAAPTAGSCGVVPAVLLALQSGWTAALWTLLAICLVQQVEANLLSPRLLSGATRLHPLAVLLAIAFGGMAGGVIGMMAALPLVVCVRGAVRGWRE